MDGIFPEHHGQVLKKVDKKIQLKWMIQAYKLFPDKENFFLYQNQAKWKILLLITLPETMILWQQIKNGVSEKEIRESWEPALSNYKKIRKKYLLYKDFE